VLHRLHSLFELGRFSVLKHKAPHFSRLSLVYARNAQGKSTVCALLRAAASSDVTAVLARKRLASRSIPTARLEWAGGASAFDGRSWTACPGPVQVFDQEYVERNVHVAGDVTRDNKRQMLQVIIGQRGVELARSIADLDAEIRAVGSRLGELERSIKTAQPVVTDVDTYCYFEIPPDIEDQVTSAGRALNLARQAAEVRERRAPQAFERFDVEEYELLLSSTVAGITHLTAERVTAHVNSHNMERHGERWLKFGIDHMQGSECPFCTQDTAGVDLVSTFEGYFSEEYSTHLARIEAAANRIQNLESSLRGIVAQNHAELAFWRNVTDLPCELIVSDDELNEAHKSVAVLNDYLARKAAHPFTKIALDAAEKRGIESAFSWLQTYSVDIGTCCVTIGRAQAAALQANVGQAEVNLAKRLALNAKGTEPLASHLAEYAAHRVRKDELNNAKAAAQSDLKAHAATTISSRVDEINDLLTVFGANFKIVDAKAGFVGREANTEYGIEIGAHILRAGPSSATEPSFKTVLSTGDKFTRTHPASTPGRRDGLPRSA
jgi:wobble nucleotide-excising tRNase